MGLGDEGLGNPFATVSGKYMLWGFLRGLRVVFLEKGPLVGLRQRLSLVETDLEDVFRVYSFFQTCFVFFGIGFSLDLFGRSP